MSDTREPTVPCPVCQGAKQLDHQPANGCLCCKGVGTVTAERAEQLARLRADITRRVAEVWNLR